MKQVTQAIILAAGMGTRLKSFTENKPKALMPIAEEAAIVRVIRRLVAAGIHDIAINLYHHGEQIQHTLGNGKHLNANLYYSQEAHLLDSGGGVRTAMDLLPHDELVLVHNADIMTDINIHPLAELCPEQGCALALVENPKHHPQGDFSLEGKHVVPRATPAHTFSGVSVWDKSVLNTYPDHHNFSLIQPIKELMHDEKCMGAIHRGHWFDIGRPHDLIQASRYYRDHAL